MRISDWSSDVCSSDLSSGCACSSSPAVPNSARRLRTCASRRPRRTQRLRRTTERAMARACLSLGSNLDPETHLRSAISALRARFGDVVVSTAYRTRAVGFDGGDFLNAAAGVGTDLEPDALVDIGREACRERVGEY